MGRPRKPLWPPGHQGFESLTFRFDRLSPDSPVRADFRYCLIWFDFAGSVVGTPRWQVVQRLEVHTKNFWPATTATDWPPSTNIHDRPGCYLFDDLPPGPYRVRFDPDTLPDGWTPWFTEPGCGCPDTDNDGDLNGWSSTIELGPDEHSGDIDFGAASSPGILAFTGQNLRQILVVSTFS